MLEENEYDDNDDEPEDPPIILKQQKQTTWLYMSLYVLLYVGLRNPQAQVITIAPITLNIFDELYLEYNETLSCPCSTTMVPYKNFVSQKFTFHPVCSSIFVSQQWIEALYLFNASKYVPFDFRTTASSQSIHYDETCH
ncbi:unnamed protein product [Adineta steineri]|uniref:Uncharacterized protein n=1 Tax=Adineta steineri TaxID=433720 RepID=A0A819NB88_9BILA|nr:unnamed protein product [Adineta steineri]